jgi:hypothetical protein
MAIDLAAIDRKINQWKRLRQLAEDPEVLEMLQELVSTNGNKPTPAAVGEAQGQLPIESAAAPTLIGTVERLINTVPGEHTVPTLVQRLERMGWNFGADNHAVAVGTAVRRLGERKAIRLLRDSSGRRPKVYAALEEGQK